MCGCCSCRFPRFLLDLHCGTALRQRLEEQRLERFIGVICCRETELQTHYPDAALPHQFDAWLWFDRTKALTLLSPEHLRDGVPDTWLFGV